MILYCILLCLFHKCNAYRSHSCFDIASTEYVHVCSVRLSITSYSCFDIASTEYVHVCSVRLSITFYSCFDIASTEYVHVCSVRLSIISYSCFDIASHLYDKLTNRFPIAYHCNLDLVIWYCKLTYRFHIV